LQEAASPGTAARLEATAVTAHGMPPISAQSDRNTNLQKKKKKHGRANLQKKQ
jgi:hypothetical protein